MTTAQGFHRSLTAIDLSDAATWRRVAARSDNNGRGDRVEAKTQAALILHGLRAVRLNIGADGYFLP